jgi:hypothetical protein
MIQDIVHPASYSVHHLFSGLNHPEASYLSSTVLFLQFLPLDGKSLL